MPVGKKLTLYWDSFNGFDDELDHSAYDYNVYIKHGTPFTNTDTTDAELKQKQRLEAVESFAGKLGEAEYYVESANYEEEDSNGDKLIEYQTYKIDYYALNEGNYYFAIWANKGNKSYGPTYYPNVYKQSEDGTYQVSDISEAGAEQKPLVVSELEDDSFSLANQIRVYGLTYAGDEGTGPTGLFGSPASKSLGGNVSALNIKNDSEPTFTYSTAFDNKELMENIYFDAKSRVTIREQNPNSNVPSKNIYFEITGQNLIDNYTSFTDQINNLDAVELLKNDDGTTKDYAITNSGFAVSNLVTEEIIPIRNFDLVVEAYTERNTKTSAGNRVHDGIINDSETSFDKAGGYDILEVNLVPPSGLMFLSEYAERDGFVTPQESFDKKVPYILEPKINDKGDIELSFLESIDSSTSFDKKLFPIKSILQDHFDGVRGGVIYYADEPFTLNPEQITLAGEDNSENQKVTVKTADSERTIIAKRGFFLVSDIKRNSLSSITINFTPFKNQSLLQTNVVIGLFDQLLFNKHFFRNGTAKTQTISNVAADTILGEKNLSFSNVISPLDQISTFDSALHLSKQPSSSVLYKKSPVDEGAKSKSFRSYIYISVSSEKSVKDLGSKGISNISSTKTTKGAQISLNINEAKPYIPILHYYEEKDGVLILRKDFSAQEPQNSVTILKPKNDSNYSDMTLNVENVEKFLSCRIFIGFLSPS